MIIRNKNDYQQWERVQITTNLRIDLRKSLKDFSGKEIHEHETKIYDCMINFFLNNENNKKILIDLIHNYR